jgi:histone-lysine N-methyltransferase SETD3
MRVRFLLGFLVVMLARAQDDDDDDSPKVKRKTYDNPDKYQNLVEWLKDGKAEFPKVEIEVRSEGYRALRAKQNIQVLIASHSARGMGDLRTSNSFPDTR